MPTDPSRVKVLAAVTVTVQTPLAPRLPLTFWMSTLSPVASPWLPAVVIWIGEALVASVMGTANPRLVGSSMAVQVTPPLVDQTTVSSPPPAAGTADAT